MSTSKRLLKGTFFFGVGKFLPKIINFFLVPIYTVFLTPEEFGIADLAITLSAFMVFFLRFGLPGAIVRFFYEFKQDKEELSNYITTLFYVLVGLSLVVGGLATVVLFFFGDFLIPGLPFWPFVPLVIVGGILYSSSDVQRRLLQVREQFRYVAVLNVLVVTLTSAATILYVVVFEWGAVGIVLAAFTSGILFFFQATYYLRKDIRGRIKTSLLGPSVNYAAGILPNHLMLVLSPLIAKSILSGSDSLAAVGVLALALRFVSPVSIILNAFSEALTPIYNSDREKSDFFDILTPIIKRIWLLGLLLFVGMATVGPEVITLISDVDYHNSAPVFFVLAFPILFQLTYQLAISEIYYTMRTRRIAIATIVGIAVEMVFIFFTVRSMGVYSLAVGQILHAIVKSVLANQFVGIAFFKNFKSLSLWWFIKSFGLALILVGMDGWMLFQESMDTWYQLVIGGLGSLIFAGVLFFSNPDVPFLAFLTKRLKKMNTRS